MNTNTKNYGAKSNIRLFFIFGFFIISKKIYIFIFGRGAKKIMEGRGRGCQCMTCGNIPKITEYLPPQII